MSAAAPEAAGCEVPPDGWWCSREAGHAGPCAARAIGEGTTKAWCAAHPASAAWLINKLAKQVDDAETQRSSSGAGSNEKGTP